MIRFLAFAFAFATTAMAADAPPTPPPTVPPADIDLTAYANGALVESADSNYGGGWDANWLTDENPAIGWATIKDPNLPATIVISLPEASEIHSLAFDSDSAESPERSAKDIDVYASASAAKDSYSLVASVSLKPKQDGQVFPLAQRSPPIKFIKLVVKSSQGSTEYAELGEFRAMGVQITTTPPPANVSGTYDGGTYGLFHLQQEGAQLSGCYEHDGGLIFGGLEAHLMRLTWKQTKSGGPALMVLSRDGKMFHGWWAMADSPTAWNANWDLKKISDKVGSCPHWNPKAASGNTVSTQLESEGRVRLYGINFDVDKDTLRSDAKPAVDQLLAALKEHGDWKVSIEGHTDSTGTPEHNLDLSQRRADAVKAALVAGGIEAARLTTKGYGQTVPIASNDTEIGRAQNRRVEVVRQ